jgi:hypothetical protein
LNYLAMLDTPNDYNNKALMDYLNWCHENLPGDYDRTFVLLSEQDIGIDMLEFLPDASTLSTQTKLPFGMTTRILIHCRGWLGVIEDKSIHFKVLHSQESILILQRRN